MNTGVHPAPTCRSRALAAPASSLSFRAERRADHPVRRDGRREDPAFCAARSGRRAARSVAPVSASDWRAHRPIRRALMPRGHRRRGARGDTTRQSRRRGEIRTSNRAPDLSTFAEPTTCSVAPERPRGGNRRCAQHAESGRPRHRQTGAAAGGIESAKIEKASRLAKPKVREPSVQVSTPAEN